MFNHILIAVSPEHAGEYSESLAAARRLLADGGKMTVLSVLEAVPSYVDAYLPAGQIERKVASVSEDLKSRFGDEGVYIDVVVGHSGNSILDWAGSNGADCIIISSHRPGYSDYFIGSTASRVVRHANCSVVVLR